MLPIKATASMSDKRRTNLRPRNALFSLVLGLLCVVGFTIPGSAAGAPSATTIEMVLTQGTPGASMPFRGTNTGTWSATGAISDTGTVVEDFQLRFNKQSTNIVYIVATEHLLSAVGTTDVRVEVLGGFTFVSPTRIRFEGQWTVAGGTGAYQTLSGHGHAVAEVDLALADAGEPSNFLILSGMAHVIT